MAFSFIRPQLAISTLLAATTTVAMGFSSPAFAQPANTAPNLPADVHTTPKVPCSGGLIGTTGISFSALLSDPDGSQDQIRGDYSISDVTDGDTVLATPSVTVSNNMWASFELPRDKFIDGHRYSWTVSAFDGTEHSATTTPCYFTVNHRQPAAPIVTSTPFDAPIRTPIIFTIAQPTGTEPVTRYVYGLNNAPGVPPAEPGPFHDGGMIEAAPGGAPTTVTLLAPRVGVNSFYVYGMNAAGNLGPSAVHSFFAAPLPPAQTGDLTGDGIPDFLTVGPPDRPGLWLYPAVDKLGHVAATGVQIGGRGVFPYGSGPADWNGTTVSAGDFDDDGIQDVLVKLPKNAGGNLVAISGRADGPSVDPVLGTTIRLDRIDEEPGVQPVDQIAAVASGDEENPALDLYAIIGDELYRYPATYPGGFFDQPELISNGWTGRTITAAPQSGGKRAIYSRNDATGELTLWTITAATDEAPTTISPTIVAASGFDAASTPQISGTDIDGDGTPDLLALTQNGILRAYKPATSPLPAPAITALESTDRLTTGKSLLRTGGSLQSPDGRFQLTLQAGNGSVVLRQGAKQLWTAGRDGARLENRSDGNLVLYRADGHVAWSSRVSRTTPATLVVQNDGNVVLYRDSDKKALWSTGTCGR